MFELEITICAQQRTNQNCLTWMKGKEEWINEKNMQSLVIACTLIKLTKCINCEIHLLLELWFAIIFICCNIYRTEIAIAKGNFDCKFRLALALICPYNTLLSLSPWLECTSTCRQLISVINDHLLYTNICMCVYYLLLLLSVFPHPPWVYIRY